MKMFKYAILRDQNLVNAQTHVVHNSPHFGKKNNLFKVTFYESKKEKNTPENQNQYQLIFSILQKRYSEY